VPDQYTFKKSCTWTDCQGRTKAGDPLYQLDFLCALQPHQPHAVTQAEEQQGGACLDRIQRWVHVRAFINHPEGQPTGSPALGIDMAHLYSMLLLSDTRNLYELRVILDPTAEDPLRKREDQTWPEWLRTVIQDPFFLGRPHCGARQVREPA
jgi:hypothetical protein